MRHAWRKRRTRVYGASCVHTRYQVCRMRRRAFAFAGIVFNERAPNTVTCVRMLPSQRRGLHATGWLARASDSFRRVFFPYLCFIATKSVDAILKKKKKNSLRNRKPRKLRKPRESILLHAPFGVLGISLDYIRLILFVSAYSRCDTHIHAHLPQQLLPIYFRD